LSGDANELPAPTNSRSNYFRKKPNACSWDEPARERIQFQGCRRGSAVGYGERAEFGIAINELVKRGEIKAPIVIGAIIFDAGSVASPNRETEGMLDGSDAIADWRCLMR